MINVFSANSILHLVERYFFRGHPYRAPLFCVFFYYGVPIAFILGHATLGKSGPIEIWAVAARRYFIDMTHLNFTVVACGIGSYLGYRYFRMVPRAFAQVQENAVVRTSTAEYQSIQETAQSTVSSLWLKLIMLVGFLGCAASFVYIAVSLRPSHWWGNIDYGYAGLSLAFMIATLFAFGIYALAVTLTVTMSMKRILLQGITYRPMHGDGYYGLRPLVKLISMKFMLVLVGGIAIFSTYYLGYFGLERSLFMFAVIAIYIIGTIAIVTRPLLVVSRVVIAARSEILHELGEEIDSHMKTLRQGAESSSKDSSRLLILEEYYKLCERKSPYPYPTNLVTAGIGTFVIQVTLYVKELYSYIRGLQVP